jgi:hypothetical protein
MAQKGWYPTQNADAQQISAVKQSEQTEPVTEKGVFWNHISSDIPETRSDDILWNLYNTEVVYLDSTYVNHLIPTRWSQDVAYFKWYNRYVPFINNLKIDSTSGRCVTGCVPVACAQVLNYLQPILGFMGTGESHGYVNGISWTEIRGNI